MPKKTKAIFAPPFDNIKVMAGQGTLGLEIARKVPDIDVVFCPVGGMGLFAGMGTAIQSMNPEVELIGVEPEGARSLEHARANRRAVALDEQIDTFVDGASVAKVGHLPFLMAHHLINAIVPASNMEIRTATTELWEREFNRYKVELAGSLAVAGLKKIHHLIEGKKVVCILTGGNLDEARYQRDVKVDLNPTAA